MTSTPIAYNLAPTQDLIDRGSFSTIIKSKEHFWITFCQAHYRAGASDRSFATAIEGKSIKLISEKQHVERLAAVIEQIRSFFLGGYEKHQNFSIVPIKLLVDFYFFQEVEVIDLTPCLNPTTSKLSSYLEWIKPVWASFAGSLGADVSMIEKDQKYKYFNNEILSQKVTVIKIDWKQDTHLKSVEIPQRVSFQSCLLDTFQKQIFCDLCLKFKDGGKILLHSSVLYGRGGCIFQNLLASLTPASTRELPLEYSQSTCRAFVKFLYSDEKAFFEQFLSQPPCDVFELLTLAHTFKAPSLEECLTNIICLLEPKQKLDEIKHYATLHQNLQLLLLSNLLTSTQMQPSEALSVQELINRRRFSTIIKSKELFWQAFCMAYFQARLPWVEFFDIQVKGSSFKEKGWKSDIAEIQTGVEKIRTFFLESYEQRNTLTMAQVEIDSSHVKIAKEAEVIDLRPFSLPLIRTAHYEPVIKPALPSLLRSLGASVSGIEKEQKCIVYEFSGIKSQKVACLKIDWNQTEERVYPFAPVKVPPRASFETCFWETLQKQIGCDLFLKSGSEQMIPIHSVILSSRGGEAFQGLLTSAMKEATTKVIVINYSESTIRAFVTFLYSDDNAFSEQFLSQPMCDVIELLDLAHTYQVPALQECLTNIINLLEPDDGLDTLKHYATLYENPHLLFLQQRLSEKGFC